MAFPTIPTVAAGRILSNTQANNTAARTFPSLTGLTKNSGDLLIAICVVYQSSAATGAVFSGWGAGFTEFADLGGTTSNMSIGAAYKFSTGSETGTFTVTQAATVTGHAAMFLLSIPAAHATSPPETGTIVHGTAAAANIAALNPAGWDTLDTLWIAVAGAGETATTGSFTGLATAPTNYTNFEFSNISSDVVGGTEAAVAFRQLNAASEDPGTFGVDITNARNSAVLFAVRPAAQTITLTHAQDTNVAQPISGTTLVKNITTATETNVVGEILPLQTLPALVAASAQPLSTQSGHPITPATETSSAQALTNIDKLVTITLAAETDSVVSSNKIITFVTETDSAQTLVVSHSSVTVTPATETDLANTIATLQPFPATVTATAVALSFEVVELSLTPATSTASAQILSFTQGGGYLIVAATETDLANTIVSLQPLPATDTATALPLSYAYSGRVIAVVTETDSAQPLSRGRSYTLTEFEATAPLPYNNESVTIGDRSTAVALTTTTGTGTHRNITPATTTDSAQALISHKAVTITLVSTTPTAQALSFTKATGGITTATSTNSALGLSFTQAGGVYHIIDVALSTDTAVALSIFKLILVDLVPVDEHDLARLTRAANRPSGGLVLIDHDPVGGLVLTDHARLDDLALIDL